MVPDAPRKSLFLVRFTEWLIPCVVVLGLLVRARIVSSAPMPPVDPGRWLLAGAGEDLAVTVILALLAALLFMRLPRAGAVVVAAIATFMLAAQFAMSEGVIFLGHAVRGDDLETGFHPLLLTGSAAGGVLAAALALVVAALVAAFVAWRLASARRSPITLARLAALAVIAVAASVVFPPLDNREAARNVLLVAPSLLRNAPVNRPPMVIPDPGMDVRRVRELAGRGTTFISDAYPLAHTMPARSPAAISVPAPHPNFVFILMESARAEEIGAYGNDPAGVTPNLDRLARDGVRVDPAFSTGGFTPEGEVGIFYGLLASPYEVVIRSRPDVRVTGFPEVLARNGWRSLLWIGSSDLTLYLGGRFYRRHGIPMIDGRDFPPDAAQTTWGFSDRVLMRRSLVALDHLQPPFAAMIVTITNHHPFQLPDDSLTQLTGVRAAMGQVVGHSTNAMLQTMHYSDQALGEFIDAARTRPWFDNTIFVICGDHGIGIPALKRPMTRHVFFELRHRIPLILYSPRLPRGVVIRGPASQADVLPTLLGAAGIRDPIAGTGIDLLDPAQHDDARPVISWEVASRTVTVNRGRFAYHAMVPENTTALTDELLVDTEADRDGRVNLIGRERDVARACRRAATIYLRTYPWLIAHDRAGTP